MLHIKLRRIRNAQPGSKYLARSRPYPLPPLSMGSIGHNSTFLEHGHAAYQIYGNHEMQQHGGKYLAHRRLPTPNPLTLGFGSVGQS